MDFLLYFHFDKGEEPDVFWESFIVCFDGGYFFLDIRESDSKKGVKFLENIAELIQYLTELCERHILMLVDIEIDFFEALDNEANFEAIVHIICHVKLNEYIINNR